MKKILALFSFPLETDKRVYGLDIMRASAILLVLISHGKMYLRPLIPQAEFLSIGGFLGVELFFVLSGFLIGGILIKMADSGNFTFSSVRKFWRRRWFRTLPNYYLILLINILLSILLFHDFTKEYFSYFLFLQNFVTPHPRIFEEAWSLSVEEWFYILLPVFMLLILFLGGKRIGGKQIVQWSSILFIITILAIRIIYVSNYNPEWANDIRKVVLFRLDTVIWGVLAAWLKFYSPGSWKKYVTPSFVLSLFLFAFVIYEYYSDVRSPEPSFFAKTFYFTLVSIAAMLLLPSLSSLKIPDSPGRMTRFFTFTSIISYSLYLVHFSIVARLISVTVPFSPSAWAITFFIFWIGSFAVASLLYKYYEKPFIQLRERF